MTGLCFIGTDTGVGKTFVTAAVARLLRLQRRNVAVCKPVATGARQTNGSWVSDDTVLLADAAGMMGELERVTPWTFPEPAAPPVAARLAGVELKFDALVQAVRDLAKPRPACAGGRRGRLALSAHRARNGGRLGCTVEMPLVLVTRRSLGTLNHTLLTLEVARSRGLPVVGVVVSETVRPEGLAAETNVEELKKRIHVPVLAVVPFLPNGPRIPHEIHAVDWWQLGHAELGGAIH